MNKLGFHCKALSHIQDRLIANGLQRGEFYNMPPGDIDDLQRLVKQQGVAASVHTPLVQSPWYPDPPTLAFLCDPDPVKRDLNFRLVEETLQLAQGWAEYVVVHFPSPPVSETNGAKEVRNIAEKSALKLAQLSREYDVPIHIEGFGPSPLLSLDFLRQVLAQCPELRYCFDTGHMNLAAKRDGIDVFSFAREIAPYIGSMHLWNARSFDDYFQFRHIPAHPVQRPEQGWADIPRLVKTVMAQNDSCAIIMESNDKYPAELGNYDYRDGISWLKQLISISY
jgi:sugar phosphate isomerase/epimerase